MLFFLNRIQYEYFVAFFSKITFGGIPFSGKPSSSSRKNFKGCMESINYNGANITDLARRKKLEPSNVVRSFTPEILVHRKITELAFSMDYCITTS